MRLGEARPDPHALFDAGDYMAALEAIDLALAEAPSRADLHANRSLVLLRLQRIDEALDAAASAMAHAPDAAFSHVRAGEAQREAGDPHAALAHFEHALQLDARDADALLGRGLALLALGLPSHALASHQAAREAGAASAAAWCNAGVCLQALGEPDTASAALDRALALRPDYRDAASNLLMGLQYDPQASADTLRESARQLGAIWNAQARLPAPGRTHYDADRPLRVGYVSSDYRSHPVGWFLRDVWPAHDRHRVHVHAYSARSDGDDLTRALRSSADAWTDITALTDIEAAARVREDRIDVLVDLGGHTAGNRLGLFANRAAPVQISWLGYFGSTGLSAIDAVLLGRDQACQGAQAFFSERLVALEHNQFCYRGPVDAAEPRIARPHQLTYGCFNNTAKLNDEVLDAWTRLLARVPGARLLLKWPTLGDPRLAARIAARMRRAGVDPARVELRTASPHSEMLSEYADVDVALDPFPFSGALSTCEALWMGVPVVTLPWQRPVSRQSMAILNDIGLGDLVAKTVDEYVDLAARLAMDWPRLAELRRGLRRQLHDSAARQAPRLARALEDAYVDLLHASHRGSARAP